MEDNNILRKKVRLLMGLQRISQKEIAEFLDISPDSLWSWLNGYYNFGKEKQGLLAEYIGLVSEIDLDRLLDFYDAYQFAEGEILLPINEPWCKFGKYYITNYASCISLCHCQWKEMTQTLDKDTDYYYITFENNGQRKKVYTHRLVAKYFVPNDNPEEKTIVHHKDGLRNASNHADNLQWVSPAEHSKIHEQIRQEKIKQMEQTLKD